MREALLGKLLLLAANAPIEKLQAICDFALRLLLAGAPAARGASSSEADLAVQPGQAAGSPRYVFRKAGRRWEVILGGGGAFRLRNTLGAQYLNYLVHTANQGIRAFKLEVEIQPEKGQARSETSKQQKSDPTAMRSYRKELNRLQVQKAAAQAGGHPEAIKSLSQQITVLERILKSGGELADTGERARNNVRKAMAVVMRELREGGPEERTFAEHLRNHLSIGHECLYRHPEGRIWK